jgi:hypothetical protein
LLVACSDAPEAPSDERHVSLLSPEGRAWFPETELDPTPQKSPWMVIYEVTRYPKGGSPSAEQRAAAEDLLRRSREAAERNGWFDLLGGLADGYWPATGDQTHYSNYAYLTDGVVLDPERPEYLMYHNGPKGKVLTGFMFLVSKPRDVGSQIGGPLTVWHYHIWSKPHCMREGLISEGVIGPQGCAVGTPLNRSPEMLHVWLVDHPKGPFATQMNLPREVIEAIDAD